MLKLGADGWQEVGLLSSDCCPPKLTEINVCGMMCNAVNLLPNGPLWERAKMEAMSKFNSGCFGTECRACDITDCNSMATYAAHMGRVLYDALMGSLFPALMESNPYTACTTVQDWLTRFGWESCFENICRNKALGDLALFETQTACGPVFTGNNKPYSLELTSAVNKAVLVSLARLKMKPIANLNGINWVIEPLSAKLETLKPIDYADCKKPRSFVLSRINNGDLQLPDCYNKEIKYISGLHNDTVVSGPTRNVWPAQLMAHCIAFSMLPQYDDCSFVPILRID